MAKLSGQSTTLIIVSSVIIAAATLIGLSTYAKSSKGTGTGTGTDPYRAVDERKPDEVFGPSSQSYGQAQGGSRRKRKNKKNKKSKKRC